MMDYSISHQLLLSRQKNSSS